VYNKSVKTMNIGEENFRKKAKKIIVIKTNCPTLTLKEKGKQGNIRM